MQVPLELETPDLTKRTKRTKSCLEQASPRTLGQPLQVRKLPLLVGKMIYQTLGCVVRMTAASLVTGVVVPPLLVVAVSLERLNAKR